MKLSIELWRRLKSYGKRRVGHYTILAIGTGHNLLVIKTNRPRFSKKGGSSHAEMRLMMEYESRISAILVMRISRNGQLRPMLPCPACARKAKDLGIKIRSIT